MTDSRHAGPLSAAAAAATNDRSTLGMIANGCGRVMMFAPGFLWVTLVYVGIAAYVPDVRQSFMTFLTYELSAVEIVYLLAGLTLAFEMLRVSKPGVDNTWEAISMGVVLVVMIVLFALANAGVGVLSIFATSEFLGLTLLSLMQVVAAFIINARTLKRTIDYSSGG